MKMFPVIYAGDARFAAEVHRLRDLGLHAFVIGVPYPMLVNHLPQVARNHDGASLTSLEQRGGLTAMEVNAILLDCERYEITWPKDQPYNHRVLLNFIQEWHRARGL